MALSKIVALNNIEIEKAFLGPNNQNLTVISTELGIGLNHVSGAITIDDQVEHTNPEQYARIKRMLETILLLLERQVHLESRDFLHIMHTFMMHPIDLAVEQILQFYQTKKIILNTFEGKKIIAKTISQKQYIERLEQSSIVFVTGSAGTGKTYLAVAYAVNLLKKNQIRKIIITRPVVEAGEKLGFLPGDLKEKVDPYLIPIYDALYEFMGKETIDKLIERGTIEIAPLAYMRGRTLDNAIIILDEAQNTTTNQMKMFITRLGFNSKMIITGDITQIDLPSHTMSGLVEATRLLKGIQGIGFVQLNKNDVMRHPLVSKIIEKYEEENDKM